MAVAFSRDGSRVVSGGFDCTSANDYILTLWDAKTGGELFRLTGPRAPILAVAFSPDGRLIAAGGPGRLTSRRVKGDGYWTDGAVHVWDTRDGRLLRYLPVSDKPVVHVSFKESLVALDANYVLREWSLSEFKLTKSIVDLQERGDYGISANRDVDSNGDHFVAVSRVRREVYNARRTGSLLRMWGLHEAVCNRVRAKPPELVSVAITRDGKRIIGGSGNHKIIIWDFATFQVLRTIEADTDQCPYIVEASPDGARVASGDADGVVRLWDIESGRILGEFRGPKTCVRAIILFPRSLRMVSGGMASLDQEDPDVPGQKRGSLKVWDAEIPTTP